MRAGKQSVGGRGAWRPDARASLGIAAVAAALMMAGFAALFASAVSIRFLQPTATVPERLVFAAPMPPTRRPIPHRRVPALSMPAPIPVPDRVWPPLQPPVTVPGGFTPQDYLQERKLGSAAALRDKVTGRDLERDLGKVTATPSLQDDQGFRTANGDKVMRSGGNCAQIHTVQGSPSPTNRIDLAEPMPNCPGSSGEDMGKALQDWAQKHRLPPPPEEQAVR